MFKDNAGKGLILCFAQVPTHSRYLVPHPSSCPLLPILVKTKMSPQISRMSLEEILPLLRTTGFNEAPERFWGFKISYKRKQVKTQGL